MKKMKKEKYNKPQVEIVLFSLKDSIATSGLLGAGLFEEIWGKGDI